MSIVDYLLSKKKPISSKAWLISRYDEDERGKLKLKITPRYFGTFTLDMAAKKIIYKGSFMRFKKIEMEIPLKSIVSTLVIANQLKIKWREGNIFHNAVFLMGIIGELKVAFPSGDAAKAWKIIIDRAILILRAKERKKKK